MSTMDYYGDLLADEPRILAFRRALEEGIRPGDRVLDLGTGLGTYAFFAVRAGASRVWAVDRGAVIHVAETLALANGLQGTIEFVRGSVPGVALPDGLDVLIFEDFPVPLLDRDTWETLKFVQENHLAADGRMIPGAARLNLAPVHSASLAERILPKPVRDGEGHALRWDPLRPVLANTPRKADLPPASLLGVPVRGEALPLLPLPSASALGLEGAWDARTPGTVHALALWFDLEVAPGDWITNAPGPGGGPWGQWLLPLEEPLPVAEGERVCASVRREVLPEGVPGWLRWEASTPSGARTGHEFAGLPMGREDVSRGGSPTTRDPEER